MIVDHKNQGIGGHLNLSKIVLCLMLVVVCLYATTGHKLIATYYNVVVRTTVSDGLFNSTRYFIMDNGRQGSATCSRKSFLMEVGDTVITYKTIRADGRLIYRSEYLGERVHWTP